MKCSSVIVATFLAVAFSTFVQRANAAVGIVVPAGVPQSVMSTASKSISGHVYASSSPTTSMSELFGQSEQKKSAHMLDDNDTTPPADFPINPDYWKFGCGGVEHSVPIPFYLDLIDLQLQMNCAAYCETNGGCYNTAACNAYKTCKTAKTQELWDLYNNLKDAINNCCIEFPGGGPDLTLCINWFFDQNFPSVWTKLTQLRACCPNCTQ